MDHHRDPDTPTRDEMLTSFPPLLIIAGTLATKTGNKHIFGPFDLTVHHYAMLHHICGEHAGCKMTELRGVWFNSAANVTQHVDALEERGLAQRVPDPADRRVTLVQITKAGTDLLDRVETHYSRSMVDFMAELSTDDLTTVNRVLRAFIDGAYALLEQAPPTVPDAPSTSDRETD